MMWILDLNGRWRIEQITSLLLNYEGYFIDIENNNEIQLLMREMHEYL